MCEVVSLSDYREKIEKRKKEKEEAELSDLQDMVDEVMSLLGDIEPEPYLSSNQDIDSLIYGGLTLGPSETALFNAYYTLLGENREDLAELVMEIIKMK